MEREKLQDNSRRVGTDYSERSHWSLEPHPPARRGWMQPTSRVEMLLNYIAGTDGKVNKFDETTIMGIS